MKLGDVAGLGQSQFKIFARLSIGSRGSNSRPPRRSSILGLSARLLVEKNVEKAQPKRDVHEKGRFFRGLFSRSAVLLLVANPLCRVAVSPDSGFVLARNPDTVRGPDVAFVSEARERGAEKAQPYFPGAPDLAIEVVSPSDRTNKVLEKVSDYLTAGCRLVWLVDPADESVQVFRAPSTPRRLGLDDPLDGEDVLPGFEVRVAEIFED